MTTRKVLFTRAAAQGLDVHPYSPGDGKTRYRFAKAGAFDNYFHCEPLDTFTALGLAEADSMLTAYSMGHNHRLD